MSTCSQFPSKQPDTREDVNVKSFEIHSLIYPTAVAETTPRLHVTCPMLLREVEANRSDSYHIECFCEYGRIFPCPVCDDWEGDHAITAFSHKMCSS